MQVVSGSSGKLVWTLKLPDDWVNGQLTVSEHENELVLAVTGLAARCISHVQMTQGNGSIWILPDVSECLCMS